MNIIDLRSDTVTLPSPEMREAMYNAVLGDDVYDEDPTVNRLQEKTAALLGKEAALFASSGTMGNFISLLVHCQRGDQAIAGESSHIALWEQNGASTLGGISLRTIPNQPDGRLPIPLIEAAINPDNIHCARTKLICLENTWNGCPLTISYLEEVRETADRHKLKIHLDGARMFNACVALNVSPAQLVKHADSVQLCFSKGLSAPIGSMIVGDQAFIKEAKRMRKVLGGAMRQVGVIAAACQVSLDKMIDRLHEDHQTAKLFADQLSQLPEIRVNHAKTNMVFFDSTVPDFKSPALLEQLKSEGILAGMDLRLGIRAVTHYGITDKDIAEVINRMKRVILKSKNRVSV